MPQVVNRSADLLKPAVSINHLLNKIVEFDEMTHALERLISS